MLCTRPPSQFSAGAFTGARHKASQAPRYPGPSNLGIFEEVLFADEVPAACCLPRSRITCDIWSIAEVMDLFQQAESLFLLLFQRAEIVI